MASGLAEKCYDSNLISWARNAVQACPSKKNMMFKVGLPRFQTDCPDLLEILAINLQSSFRSPSFGRWCLNRMSPLAPMSQVSPANRRSPQFQEPARRRTLRIHGTMAYRSATMDPLVSSQYQESHQGWRSILYSWRQLSEHRNIEKPATRFLSNQGHVIMFQNRSPATGQSRFLWKCCVPRNTHWFCWSLSLWKMASYHWEYINPTFSVTNPSHGLYLWPSRNSGFSH